MLHKRFVFFGLLAVLSSFHQILIYLLFAFVFLM